MFLPSDLIRIIQSKLKGCDWLNSLFINKMWYHAPIDKVHQKYKHIKKAKDQKIMKKIEIDYNLKFWRPNHLGNLLVFGPSSSGKTTMVYHLSRKLKKQGYIIHYISGLSDIFDKQLKDGTFNSTTFSVFLDQTLDFLERKIRAKLQNKEKSDVSEYIVIDNIYFEEIHRKRLEDDLKHMKNCNMFLIIAANYSQYIFESHQTLQNHFQQRIVLHRSCGRRLYGSLSTDLFPECNRFIVYDSNSLYWYCLWNYYKYRIDFLMSI